MKTSKMLVGVTVAMLLAPQLSAQQTTTWDNTTTGFFHFAPNWDNGLPTANHHAHLVQNDENYTIIWDSITGNTTSRSVLVQNGGPRFLQTSPVATQIHTVLDDVIVESGSLIVDRHILSIQENLEVSDTLLAEDGANVNVGENLLGSPETGDVSNIEITGANTSVNVIGNAIIGQFGNSDLVVTDQAALDIALNLRVGFNGFGSVLLKNGATLEVESAASAFGQTIVGGNGNLGVLDFFSGATGTTEALIVTSNGIVDIVDGSSSLTANETSVSGVTEPVAINIVDGGNLNSGNGGTVIADNPGTTGLVTIGDAGSAWMIDGPFDIGAFGSGEFQVINGGQVVSNGARARLGVESIGGGVVTVTGAGSTWTTDNPIDVGFSGVGELKVLDGGQVISASGVTHIGDQSEGSGFVLVSGSDALFDIANLDVGRFGEGDMQVLSGGRAITTDGFIGLNDVAGRVLVSGSGSQWDTGFLQLGDTMDLTQGGSVNCTNANVIQNGIATVANSSSIWSIGATLNVDNGELHIVGGKVNAGDSVVIDSNGLISMENVGSTFGVGAGLTNDGTLQVTGAEAEILGNVFNDGTISKAGSGGLAVIGDLSHFSPATIEIVAGNSMSVHGGFTSDTAVSGTGSMFLLGDFNPGDGIGSVTFEGNVQLRPTSTTHIEIGGTSEFDSFDVASELMIQTGAQLNVQFIDGFNPAAGDSFLIAQASTLSGAFNGLEEGAVVGTFGGTDLVITYQASDGNDIALIAMDDVMTGDINGDGEINLLDVAPFVDLLATGTFQAEADINGDGDVNLLDVGPFVALLSGT